MEGSEILQTLAEVAVALAGFTGIVVALGDRSGSWRRSGFAEARFRILLAGSLAALLQSLLPFVLHHLGVSPPTVWAVCSALVTVFLSVVAWLDVRGFRAHASEVPRFERRAAPVIVVLAAALWILQVWNVLELHAFGPYLMAPMWFLAFSVLAFVRLLADLRDGPEGA